MGNRIERDKVEEIRRRLRDEPSNFTTAEGWFDYCQTLSSALSSSEKRADQLDSALVAKRDALDACTSRIECLKQDLAKSEKRAEELERSRDNFILISDQYRTERDEARARVAELERNHDILIFDGGSQ